MMSTSCNFMKNDHFYEEKCTFNFLKKHQLKKKNKKKIIITSDTISIFYFIFF